MRQYISDVMPDGNGILESDERGFRHLKNVLRVANGDMIRVRLPDGALRDMTVCKIDAKRKVVAMQLCDTVSCADDSALAITNSAPVWWLFMFIAKPQKMELVIRQATECGVKYIVPVIGEYSQAGNVSAFKARAANERFLRIVLEAREQSGSAVATEISEALTVSEAAEVWQNHCAQDGCDVLDTCAFVLYEKSSKTRCMHEVIGLKNDCIKNIAVAVGCEGGIAPSEIDILCGAGFVPVHFDTNILRCETAALYGIAAAQAAVTERNIWDSKE